MAAILRPGRNCERICTVTASGLLVDARDYYLAVHEAIAQVERFVLIAGWQFDSRVELVRGKDRVHANAPPGFLELLRYVEKTRPDVRIYLLAWDYSVLFSLEREWMQKVKFGWMTGEQVRFVFDRQHPPGASHHQKLVVVDGSIAFLGGIDLCGHPHLHSFQGADRRRPADHRRLGQLHQPQHELRQRAQHGLGGHGGRRAVRRHRAHPRKPAV